MDMRRVSLVLLSFASLATAGQVATHSPEEESAATAAEEHEKRAQQALTDSLTDAIAMLRHGSATAKEQAAAGVAQMAVETTLSQPFHPVTFRNACVRSGVVEELSGLLSTKESTPGAKLHALAALEAIATDDPSTDLDNGHALAVCNAGVVPPLVALLSATEEALQVHAASCASVLAENPLCQSKLLQQGVVRPLVLLGTYGNDLARMHSVAALDLLVLNNPQAQPARWEGGGRAFSGERRGGDRSGGGTGTGSGEQEPKSIEELFGSALITHPLHPVYEIPISVDPTSSSVYPCADPQANEMIKAAGGLKLLQGINRYGGSEMRRVAQDVASAVDTPAETLAVAVDAKAHATQAHEARMKHSKILGSAMGVRRAYAPGQRPD